MHAYVPACVEVHCLLYAELLYTDWLKNNHYRLLYVTIDLFLLFLCSISC